MRILKKVIIIFIISLMFLYSIIPSKSVYALSQEQAGQVIAEFAKDTVINHQDEFVYDYGKWTSQGKNSLNYGREEAYRGNKVSGWVYTSPNNRNNPDKPTQVQDMYAVDCVGFVDFVLHHSLGLQGDATTTYVTPQRGIKTEDFENRGWVNRANLQAGDILVSDGHVAVYIGNGQIAESTDYHRDPSKPEGGVQIREVDSFDYNWVARIRETSAQNINPNNIHTDMNALASADNIGSIIPSADASDRLPEALLNPDNSIIDTIIGGFKEKQYLVDAELDPSDIDGLGNSKNFYYNGIPKEGEYLGKTKKQNWLFNSLSDVGDWLVGIITMNVKVQAVGWASIFENLANNFVEAVTNTDLETKISVEDIIYNRVPVLDVNIFSDTAGGQPIETAQDAQEDLGVIAGFRGNIASIYSILRTTAIILLLITLLYLGIRMAISSVASEKAEYKQKLIGWVVSFAVVMFIHYFMVVILNFNDVAVKWIKPESNVSSVYETVRAYAYEIPATKGLTGAIIYVFLVYFLIKLLYFYLKRLLIVYVLIIIAPVMGVVYSFQRINGKSKSLSLWMKDFAFNVFIRFVHAFMYSVVMGIVVMLADNAKITQIIPASVVLFVVLNFLLNADKIITHIFKIQAPSLKSVIDSAFRVGEKLAPAYFIWKSAISPAGKSIIEHNYDKNLQARLNNKYDMKKLPGDSALAKNTNEIIEKLKQQEFDHIKELDSNAVKFAMGQFKGIVDTVTGVPVMFEKPEVGAFIYGNRLLNNTFLDSPMEPGKAGRKGKEILNNPGAGRYIYIDPSGRPVTGTRSKQAQRSGKQAKGKGGAQQSSTASGNTSRSGETIQSEVLQTRRTIRSYNTSRVPQRFTFGRGIVTWATMGKNNVLYDSFEVGEQEERIIRGYSVVTEKVHKIANRASEEIQTIDAELTKIKVENRVPIYYEPKQDGTETETEVKMNQTMRRKYRDTLEKNIRQMYEGTDKKKVEEQVTEHIDKKITLKTVEEIAKEYASKTKTTLGEEFKTNLDDKIEDKIIETITNDPKGFEKLKLKPEIQERIKKAIEDNTLNDDSDRDKLKESLKEIITDDVKEEVVSKISVKDLTEIIASTLDTKGSLNVDSNFTELVQPVETLRLLNEETKATVGSEIYTTEQLLDLIMNKDLRE